ncbi:hypothetical protein A0H81_10543 [Grifola frondosa]|uniref:Uncharacterized protein n=1 Tax=Grifola frondosa TaxID=5627 RepID=A0A1C7M028_GRIFR|nr:hypothetical protein A0H81_10543 [Grifola frondosa]
MPGAAWLKSRQEAWAFFAIISTHTERSPSFSDLDSRSVPKTTAKTSPELRCRKTAVPYRNLRNPSIDKRNSSLSCTHILFGARPMNSKSSRRSISDSM